jgi:hypothetical protein
MDEKQLMIYLTRMKLDNENKRRDIKSDVHRLENQEHPNVPITA